jgi:hypothetical protein
MHVAAYCAGESHARVGTGAGLSDVPRPQHSAGRQPHQARHVLSGGYHHMGWSFPIKLKRLTVLTSFGGGDQHLNPACASAAVKSALRSCCDSSQKSQADTRLAVSNVTHWWSHCNTSLACPHLLWRHVQSHTQLLCGTLAHFVFAQVPPPCVMSVHDVSNIYRVPLLLLEQGFPALLAQRLRLGGRHVTVRPSSLPVKEIELYDRMVFRQSQ